METNRHIKQEDLFLGLLLLLTFGTFYYHLGLMPFLDDESTRALVSLEMVLSKNYVVPTTHGELYQNKPPLFNWFVAWLMNSNSQFNELSLRVPSMLAFLVTALAIYLFFRKEINPRTALLTSFAYLTCGRILFYDSMLGYIDPFFTFILFLEVVVLYQFTKGTSHWLLFILSYFLCLVAYLLKGLPAIAFHGLSLVCALVYAKKPKLFVSLPHVGGVLTFVVFLGLYYLAYSKQQSLDGVIATLWEQSSRRTVSSFTWQESVEYIITFPLQFVMHFLPWSLFVLVLFNKRAISHIRRQRCLAFCALLFLGNIVIYWFSPETKPRYLFIFLPLFFACMLDAFFAVANKKWHKVSYWAIIGLSTCCALAVTTPCFIDPVKNYPFAWVICLAAFVTIGGLVMWMILRPNTQLISFGIVLLCVRMVFNHFILPARKAEAPESAYKKAGVEIGSMVSQKPLHLLQGTMIDHDVAYYISSTNKRILDYYPGTPKEGEFYICSPEVLKANDLVPLYTFTTSFRNATLFLAQKK